ncbi:PREDICTED: MAP3K7 C-terminal-like protein [Thamnophis sirtalis]|uniref:MAP3K7 C-terminal-like protein n=1 Tax=Thamnophis sirtalis TaxID=35019 RepID=A0A6I9XHA8_9SAUR|nr:PREDICTED: MAP3K7 C-terminal-like protein [Thamnophis sirtalis]
MQQQDSSQVKHTTRHIGSSAHMITTARVPADKRIRIAFSLNDSPGNNLQKKELITRLDEAEKENRDAAQLTKEYADLTDENRTLKLTQTQCVEQLEKLRIQYQKRQGSS